MRFLLILFAIFAVAAPTFAATRSEPALLEASLIAHTPSRDGLSLVIRPDEQACRKQYGSRWQQKCAGSPGIAGHVAKGLKLVPSAPGRWQWRDGNVCSFIPASGSSLRPGTSYTVDLSELILPGHLVLGNRQVTVKTPPLAAMLLESRFWTDPSPAARHRLNFSVAFNYPLPNSGFEPAIELPAGASAGKPELIWNGERDRLSLSLVMRSLPDRSAPAILKLPCARFSQGDSGLKFTPVAQFSQVVPSVAELFRIKGCKIVTDLADNLDERHVLEIETSLYVSGDDLLKRLIVLELPEYKSGESFLPFNWRQAGAVSPEAVRNGRELVPVPMQDGSVQKSGFRFALPVKGGRHVLVVVGDGLQAAGGERLAQEWADIVETRPLGSRVGFLQPGQVMSPAGTLDLYGSDIERIDWRIEKVREPFLALLAQSSWNVFESPLAGMDLGSESLTSALSGSLPLLAQTEGQARYGTLVPGEELEKRGLPPSGLVFVTLSGIKGGKEAARARRLLLLTDMGLVVKRAASGSLECFASRNNLPARGARISILGANGQIVASAAADARGHARFDGISGLEREVRPVAAIAGRDGDLVWLPLADRGRQITFQEQASGVQHVGRDAIVAHVFCQSGIFRPGDIVNFGVMARKADFSLLPPQLPLFAKIIDPAGRAVWEKTFTAGEHGLAELVWASLPEAISGRYHLEIRAAHKGMVLESLAFKLEQFQPDTLKLQVAPPAYEGWLVARPGQTAAVSIALRNLFGDPAGDHIIRPRLSTAPALFRFARHGDYIFTDPAPFLGAGQELKLPELRTGPDGNASFAIPPEFMQVSADITVAAEGFDKSGGRAVGAASVLKVSPADRILGYRLFGRLANLDYINVNDKAEVELLAVDSSLAPVACKDVSFTLYELSSATSLIADGTGGYRYDETPCEKPIRVWKRSLPAGPLACALDTSRPGDFVLVIRDGKDSLLARIPYSVCGDRLAPAEAALAASSMRMRLDKQEYAPGDVMEVSFSLPYDACGLVSLERDSVEAFEWVNGHAGDNVVRIGIPEGFSGNGYAVLTLARNRDSAAIYVNPLAHAVMPFKAGIKKRESALKLTAPANCRPGQELEIFLSASKPGSAVLFAVDEGVLQLAPWAPPAPLAGLVGNRAHDVATLQIMDLLMPDHRQLARRISAFGGGTEAAAFGSRFQNPFKRKSEPPLMFWSGILPVGSGPVSVKIPTASWQSGNVRLFAVTSSQDGAGIASATCKLAAPLVLTPVLPLNVAPGDQFRGSLVLANTTDVPMELLLTLDSPKALKVTESLPERLSVPPRSEALAHFAASVSDLPGEAEIGFRAISGTEHYERKTSLSVRPAAAFRQTWQAGVAEKSCDLPPTRAVYPFMARSEAMISGLPLPLATGLARYLETYPYGCTEQLVSRAFAQACLFGWPDTGVDPEQRQRLLVAARDAITARFDGQMVALWPGGSGDLLTTAYAADYLLSLRERGLGEPGAVLAAICDSLDWNCTLNSPDLASARASAYAIWVMARAGKVVSQRLAELEAALRELGVQGWHEDLTGVLIACARREMGMPAQFDLAAIALAPAGWFDEYAQASLLVALAARYFPEALSMEARQDYFLRSSMALVDGGFATFSAAQGIRALSALAGASAPALLQAKIYCREPAAGEQEDIFANAAFYRTRLPQCKSYHLKVAENSTPVFWQVATEGYDRAGSAEAVANGLEIERIYLDASGQPVSTFRQGDELTVRLTIRSQKGALPDCVIGDLLPGGFEMAIPAHEEALPEAVKFLDRQEDRLLVFLDADNEPLTLEYRCRAVHPGSFIVPPAAVEAMYDRGVNGRSAQGRIEIMVAQ